MGDGGSGDNGVGSVLLDGRGGSMQNKEVLESIEWMNLSEGHCRSMRTYTYIPIYLRVSLVFKQIK